MVDHVTGTIQACVRSGTVHSFDVNRCERTCEKEAMVRGKDAQLRHGNIRMSRTTQHTKLAVNSAFMGQACRPGTVGIFQLGLFLRRFS